MGEPPKVTLHYVDPRVKDECHDPWEVAIAKLEKMNGVSAKMRWPEEGDLNISLEELHPGGLECAVRECVELFFPLSGIRSYNAEGHTITERVLRQLGYELEQRQFPATNATPYLGVVHIPEALQKMLT